MCELKHAELRSQVADHLSQHQSKYQPFLDEPLDSYVTELRKESTWAGELELTALCTLYKYVVEDLPFPGPFGNSFLFLSFLQHWCARAL